MPNVNDLKQSRFLTQKDFQRPVLMTITGYEEANIARGGAEPDMQWILHFKESEKPFILKPTNGQLIEAITGSGEFKDWIGKKIVMYVDPTISFGGELKGGVRCRAPQNLQQPKPPQEPEPTEPNDDDDIPF